MGKPNRAYSLDDYSNAKTHTDKLSIIRFNSKIR